MTLPTEGQYRLSKSGNILIIEAQGPFNETTVNQYLVDIKLAVEDLKHSPWATLAIFSGKGIFSPDAEQIIIDITRQRMQNNMVAVATVLTQSAQIDILQMQLNRIYQACNIVANFFPDSRSALQWLDDYLVEQTVN